MVSEGVSLLFTPESRGVNKTPTKPKRAPASTKPAAGNSAGDAPKSLAGSDRDDPLHTGLHSARKMSRRDVLVTKAELARHVAVDLSLKELLNAHPKFFQSSSVRNHRDRVGVRCL